MIPTVGWEDGAVVMVDQRRLPAEEVYLRCHDPGEVAAAIRDMAIRGAPAIGVAAAFGVALGVRQSRAEGSALLAELEAVCELLRGARPTAVNLSWAIERMKARFVALAAAGGERLREGLLDEALAIDAEDVAACRRMGDLGAELIPPQARILTHCNAGALATAGYGTALGVVRSAARLGKVKQVYADETRPYLQGARLTAWELLREGIPTTLIADSAAGHLMATGQVDTVVVGADRIAANGDVANKIGTYTVAVLAREHGIPFFGICLGMQLAVAEYARNVAGLEQAHSVEFDPDTPHPIIYLMKEWVNYQTQAIEHRDEESAKGGTMRLGAYPCHLERGSFAFAAYKQKVISERHRHRYEFNNHYREPLLAKGLRISGVSPDNELVEIIEIPDHPWFLGCQFHPEFQSRPWDPHPLFREFIRASREAKRR